MYRTLRNNRTLVQEMYRTLRSNRTLAQEMYRTLRNSKNFAGKSSVSINSTVVKIS